MPRSVRLRGTRCPTRSPDGWPRQRGRPTARRPAPVQTDTDASHHPQRHSRFLFCYVSSNSNFSATGGGAMTDYLDKRFPFAPYPKGWFQIAYSRDVEPVQIIGLHYFGRRLICYRGDSGTPYVLDAYCPHLGADITVGGAVVDDCVTCPFHGWRFDGSGSNVEIPYAKTVNRTARLRAWPTAERAGIIFVWYSAESTEPEWELPKIPESDD